MSVFGLNEICAAMHSVGSSELLGKTVPALSKGWHLDALLTRHLKPPPHPSASSQIYSHPDP